jgi:peroxiredoxin
MSTPVWLSFGALWTLVVFQGLVLLGLVKTVYTLRGAHTHDRNGDESEDILHQRAPEFRTLDLAGASFDSAQIADQPRALLFVSPRCRSCSVTSDELESLTWKAGGKVYVICRGDTRECEEFSELHGLGTGVLIDDSFEISRAFKVTAVPTAILIDDANIVQSYGNPMRDEELIEVLDENLDPVIEEVH